MSSISTRKYLNALRPPLDIPDVAVFNYPNLESVVEDNFSDKFESIDEIFERYDADDEEVLDLRLSHEYLIMAALKLQRADSDTDRELWSKRYTSISVDTFGQPDLSEVSNLARQELDNLLSLDKASIDSEDERYVYDAYKNLIVDEQINHSVGEYSEVLYATKRYLKRNYRNAFTAIGSNKDRVFLQNEVVRSYQKALNVLGWTDWTVKSNSTAQMSVSPAKKVIYVGKYLPPLSLARVHALFAHEVLTHAQRAVRGSRIDNSLLMGLPGYLTFEEGLGVLLEAATNIELPRRVADRYIDIALALGMGSDQAMSRRQLFRLATTRALMRLGSESGAADMSLVRRLAWQHVNRIYKGSLGNEFVGVFTRDVSYYIGFKRAASYLMKNIDSDFDGALNFALSGKFDPTNSSHTLYVHKKLYDVKTNLDDIAP